MSQRIRGFTATNIDVEPAGGNYWSGVCDETEYMAFINFIFALQTLNEMSNDVLLRQFNQLALGDKDEFCLLLTKLADLGFLQIAHTPQDTAPEHPEDWSI